MNTKSIFACAILCAFSIVATGRNLHAETGDDNPTGPAGMFNGNITTGGSYDPYTRNAMRQVTDIVVAGAVGTRPLAFTRVANTRGNPFGISSGPFGNPGNWNHSYNWGVNDEPYRFSDPSTLPTAYNVDFPDGRAIRFTSAVGTPAGDAGDSTFRGPIGLSERLTPLNTPDGSVFLILTDGTQVKFQATLHSTIEGEYFRSYKAVEIIDPFGLVTTLSYSEYGNLDKITEPAGRWLQLSYGNFEGAYNVITSVQSSDGREIQYTYNSASFSDGAPVYGYLESVSYYDDASIPNAYYVYKAPNVPDYFGEYSGVPNLAYCDDPMYSGSMKQIAYDYLHYVVDPYAVYGELLAEKHEIAADPVSTIESGGNGVDITRTETRGDGPSRTFTYRTWPYLGHLLFNYTGFNGENAAALGYNSSNYLSNFTDANSNATGMLREVITGRITQLTHPPDDNDVQSSVLYGYGSDTTNPYYLDHKTDELGNTISYQRDSLHRITRVDYPDGGYETFTYNGFNQILTHRLTSSGTEVYTFDGRGLKTSFQNADGKLYNYGYDALDRLSSVSDPEGFETNYEYNTRGQLTKTILPTDPNTGIRYTKINGYNGYGTLTSVTDELNHVVVFTVDGYQRVVDRQDQLLNHTTYSYVPWGQSSSYVTTSKFVYSTTSPSGKQISQFPDNEFRLVHSVEAPGTADQADTYFTYDPVGNRIEMKDPLLNVTSYEYDKRNRKTSSTDALMQITKWDYDQAGNQIKETRPDLKYRTWDLFDAMNRVKQATDFLGQQTTYEYDLAGNITQMTDSKGAIYGFSYDLMNRKNGATYPTDATGNARSESWSYNDNGNMSVYTNPAGKRQTFTYDNRNRPVHSSWNAPGPNVTTGYDAASRVTSVSTADGTTVSFGYDAANRQIWEEQSLTGQPLRHIDTPVDVDGNRASLSLSGAYTVYYDYTQRQQLAHIRDNPAVGQGQWFEYSYDLNGNVTKRQNVVQGLDSTNFTYDPLDRVTLCTQTGQDDVAFATSHYDYDLNGNIQDTYRDEQAGKGERFGYDDANRLISAVYNADDVQTPNPTNYDRSVNYTLGPLNRLSMNDNGAVTNYAPNDLNQYTNITGHQSRYDQNFNHRRIGDWNYQYDASGRLVNANNPGTGEAVQFLYDGLNRCVRRVTGSVLKHITYDGWKPIAEWGGNGALVAWNVYGPGPDEVLLRYDRQFGYLHYHADQFGNVKFLLDMNNAIVEEYTYDAFGAPRITDANDNVLSESAYKNRFMFTGREYLTPVGIYDYRNRMYSPLIGRFLQTDPLGFDAGDINLYRYAGHNPANASDPDGTRAIPSGNHYEYVLDGGRDYLEALVGARVRAGIGGPYLQCAGTCQVLAGGYDSAGVYRDVPQTRTRITDTPIWHAGAPLSRDTRIGTVVATNWNPDGSYPNIGGGSNHTLFFGGLDASGNNAILYSATANTAISRQIIPIDQLGNYNVVTVNLNDGPYGVVSTGVVVIGLDPDTGAPIYEGRVVGAGYGSSETRDSWGMPSVGGTVWGNPAYMPGLLSSLVPKARDH